MSRGLNRAGMYQELEEPTSARTSWQAVMEHIRILAHSADGAALRSQEMVREGTRRLGAHLHPERTLSILPLGAVLDACEPRDLAVPEAQARRFIDRVSFDELCQGVVGDDSRAECLRVIERMKGEGCDALALACTELPLLVTPGPRPRRLVRSGPSAGASAPR